jgi:hypothetical protein
MVLISYYFENIYIRDVNENLNTPVAQVAIEILNNSCAKSVAGPQKF